MMPLRREFGRHDAWGARWAAEGTDWGAYLDTHLDRPCPEPSYIDDPESADWQRYMRRDCLYMASAIATKLRLPVGRLMKGGQLAHAFVILPNWHLAPDQLACLDWSGVRRMKRIKDDMREAWGRLVLDDDMTPLRTSAEVMRDARTRPHIAEALKVEWPRVAVMPVAWRMRYLDVIDCTESRRRNRRTPDMLDIR